MQRPHHDRIHKTDIVLSFIGLPEVEGWPCLFWSEDLTIMRAWRFDFHGHFGWWESMTGHMSIFSSIMCPALIIFKPVKPQNETLCKMLGLTWSAVTLMYLFVCHGACAWNVSVKCKEDTTTFLMELQKENPSKYAVLSK